jgi:hypothetical protein
MNPLQELPASDISSLELLHNLHQSALKEYNFSTAFLTPEGERASLLQGLLSQAR